MSKIRVRSYLDGNAPQFNAAAKNGIIPFMKAMFEQESYGSITPTAYEQDLVNNQLILTFSTTPGFSPGNLIQIVGSSKTSINNNYFRVVATDGLRLFLKYDYSTLEDLTSGFIPSALVVRHAPMDWEVLYSTDIQFSMRSKNETSSKTILTYKRPQNTTYDTSNQLYTTFFHASKGLDVTTGEIFEDYFQKRIQEISNNTESPYHVRVAGNQNNYSYNLATNNTTTKYPWYLVGDDRFFYLIIGNAHNEGNNNRDYMNFVRNPGNADTRRCVYLFGDPDKVFQDDPEDPTGFIFNTSYYNPITMYSQLTSNGIDTRVSLTDYPAALNNPANRSHDSAPCLFLREYNNLPGTTFAANLHTMSYTGTNPSSAFSYPGPFSHGIYFFPIYSSVMFHDSNNNYGHNTSAYLRSKLPWALAPFQSLRNITNSWVDLDYSIIKAQGKNILTIVTYAGSNTLHRSVSFELD